MQNFKGHNEVWNKLESIAGSRVPPALIFSGPNGIGKKQVALAFARLVTDEARAIDVSQSMAQTDSVFFVSPDGSQIKTDQVREVLHFLSLARDGRPLVVIFNDAHLINAQAGNALLKSVEEPPDGVSFIFVSPSPTLLLSTLRSRSQVVRFAPLSDADVCAVVKSAEPELELDATILSMAAGSAGLALEIARGGDQIAAVMPVVDELLLACGPKARGSERAEALASLREAAKERDRQAIALRFLVRRMAEAWRAKAEGATATDNGRGAGWLTELPFEKLERASELALEAEADLGRNVDRQLLWEAFSSRLNALAQD